MAYDRNRGITPGGQFFGMLGTSLSQILGGYLGAKLEQDKERREFGANKRILQRRFPNMPPEQLDQASRIPSKQLPEMISGINASEFRNVMQGPTPEPGQVEQPIGGSLAETLQPSSISQQQDMIQPQQPIQDKDITKDDTEAISDEAERITALENRLKEANLDPSQYEKVSNYISKSKQILRDTIVSDAKIQRAIEENKAKQAIAERKTSLAERQFERQILTEDRAYERSKLEQKGKEQDRLYKEYGESYKTLQDSYSDLIEDKAILEEMKAANEDPNITFGSASFNTFAGFLKNKLGIDISALQDDTAQILIKQSADLFARLPKSLKGTGIRAGKVLEIMAKKYPNIHQSYIARAAVVETNLAKNKVNLARIKVAEKLKKENGYKFITGFSEKVNERMTPYYKEFLKTIEDIPKKIEKNKNLQMKQRAFDRGSLGSIAGGILGGAASVLGTAATGALVGGIPGAIAGTVAGGIGLLPATFTGAMAGEKAAGAIGSLSDVLGGSGRRDEEEMGPLAGLPRR